MLGTEVPPPLRVAAGLVVVEAILIAGYAVDELLNLGSGDVQVGVTASVFFLLCAVALGFCAWGMVALRPWSRSPVLMGQLIVLGLAWSMRTGATVVAIVAAVIALIVLAGVLHPHSIDVLNREEHRRR